MKRERKPSAAYRHFRVKAIGSMIRTRQAMADLTGSLKPYSWEGFGMKLFAFHAATEYLKAKRPLA